MVTKEEVIEKKKTVTRAREKLSGKRSKSSIVVDEGRIYAKFSFNNTVMSITKTNGDVLKQVSGGYLGFKNTKKSAPYVAQKCVESVVKNMLEKYNMKQAELWVNGVGAGRELVIKRILGDENIVITALVDKTPIAYGGCRPRKRPRK